MKRRSLCQWLFDVLLIRPVLKEQVSFFLTCKKFCELRPRRNFFCTSTLFIYLFSTPISGSLEGFAPWIILEGKFVLIFYFFPDFCRGFERRRRRKKFWKDENNDQKGLLGRGKVMVLISPRYFRPFSRISTTVAVVRNVLEGENPREISAG